MARAKAFDPDETLDRAVELFWRHGYEGTSIDALAEATGLNRSSIYNTFGSKRRLYLAALDRYRRVAAAPLLDPLREALPLRTAMERVFRRIIDESLGEMAAVNGGRPPGCFVACATLDQAPHDPETSARVADSMAAMEAAFHRRLAKAQAEGELSGERSPQCLARFLVSAVNGLRVMGQGTGDRDAMEDAAEVALSVLG